MTVLRSANDCFETSPEKVAVAIRAVLARDPSYYRKTMESDGFVFKTCVQPSWWLLKTPMVIQVRPFLTGAKVSVRTESQAFIQGDVFGYYARYIQKFLEELQAEIDCVN